MLSGKTRPVSWEASENRPVLKKQNPVDVGFKEKHETYEKLQRQATTVRDLVCKVNKLALRLGIETQKLVNQLKRNSKADVSSPNYQNASF